jgi:pimeloyl-ACP methyl ester carboxylesterase
MTPASDGIELCYEIVAERGEPLLLIAGHGAQLIWWHADLLDGFVARGFAPIVFDNRDAGLSTHLTELAVPDLVDVVSGVTAPPYTIEDMAADGDRLLRHLGIDAAHVLGVSMGGMVAQSFAINHPNRTKSLTSVMSSPDPLHVGTPTPEVLAEMAEPGPTTRADYLDRSLRSWRAHGSPKLGIDEAWVLDMSARSYDRAFDPAGVARQAAAIVGSPDRRPGLGAVTAPTLVVHGTIDPVLQLEGGEATAKAVPSATLLVIDDMGHDLPESVWPKVLDAVAANAGLSA